MASMRPRRVLITAAASGIGLTMARRFAALGDVVRVCDVDDDALAMLGTTAPDVRGRRVNLGEAAEVRQWCAELIDELDGVDVLVNNAGIAGPTAYVEDVSLADWQHCLAVGLQSHFLTCAAVAPVMKQQRSGVIVNISSTAGLVGYGMRSPYAAAKWAVIGLTKSLAVELGPYDVRVNAICPGSVDGPRMQRVIDAQAQARGLQPAAVADDYLQGQSIPRWVSADDVAAMCAFLASEEARMVSGQAIAVDGHTETFHL